MAKVVVMNGQKKIVARRPNGVIEFRPYQPNRTKELMNYFKEKEEYKSQSMRASIQLV